MDEEAVWAAEEKQLESLGLVERGHIICLKSFCVPSDLKDTKAELANTVKQAKIQPSTLKKLRKNKMVLLGWQHFNNDKSKYCSVRQASGGGVRKVFFPSNALKTDILEKAKFLFFPRNKNLYGNLSDMNINLGNYAAEPIDHQFVLTDYIDNNCFSKTRLYLLTKTMNARQKLHSIAFSDDSDSDFEDAKIKCKNILKTKDVIDISDDSIYSSFDSPDNDSFRNIATGSNVTDSNISRSSSAVTLIGTTRERQILKEEIESSLRESERLDNLKEENALMKACLDAEYTEKRMRLEEEAEDLRKVRALRLMPEPNLSDDNVVISVRHPELGTLRRIFPSCVTMNSAYDWIGSKAVFPMYFKLLLNPDVVIQPSEKISVYGRNVLQMQEINMPLQLEEENEVSMKGFSLEKACNLDRIEQKRLEAKSKLQSDGLPILETSHFQVDRHNIINDLFIVYAKRVASKHISVEFADEDAVGDGVTRDVYSCFYKELYRFNCSGINAHVPSTSLSDSHAEKLGVIISHAFIQYNIFPIRLAKATFQYMVTDDVNDDTLMESFLLFIDTHERAVFEKCVHDESQFNEAAKNIIWDVLMDCGVTSIPSKNNLRDLMLDAARNVLIKKPFFVLKKIQDGLGNFWKNITVAEINELWKGYTPTAENIMDCFDFDIVKTPIEERICAYFQRYLRNSTEETLSLLLQYATGCATIDKGEKVKLEFVNQDPRNLNVLAKACFKILYIPRQVDNFNCFKVLVDNVLKNSYYWSMYD